MSATTAANLAKEKAQDLASGATTPVKETVQEAASATASFASQATDNKC